MISDHLKIGPFDYRLEVVDDLCDGSRSLDGWVKYRERVISLDSSLGEQSRMAVLWHEVIHAICDHAGVDLDESDVDRVALGVLDVLKHNSEMRMNEEQTVSTPGDA